MIKGIFAIFVYIILFTKLNAYELKFEEIYKDLNSPWSLSFLDNENIILTEKSGNLLTFNLIERKTKKIEHIFNELKEKYRIPLESSGDGLLFLTLKIEAKENQVHLLQKANITIKK